MIEFLGGGAYFVEGTQLLAADKQTDQEAFRQLLAKRQSAGFNKDFSRETARTGTIAYQILSTHNQSGLPDELKITFDSLASHDITYVGIIQTAIASGMQEFPVPYVMTNCHNSLCAVGGTINEDDHIFGLSAARKYGGIFVPAHQAVIHQYMREMMAGCGRMILGSDSHTRYGALGTLAIGEGGPEIAKQLLKRTYDLAYPEVVAVYLEGTPLPGVGPQDVALAIIGAVFKNGFVKNKILEFIGPGIDRLSVDFRNGIDVMTTETTCLSSIWRTDQVVRDYFSVHGRPEAYRELKPADIAYYDGAIRVNLSRIVPMIALPFHPSNIYSIEEVNRNPAEILHAAEQVALTQLDGDNLTLGLTEKIINGRLKVEQGIVAGCAGGTFENITAVAQILAKGSVGNGEFGLGVYPASQPIFAGLIQNQSISSLISAGAVIRTAFCGPCFGAGDTPAHRQFSIRHVTRNFPNREGSKPNDGQVASVALMDARSIAATALNGGYLTPATECDYGGEAGSYQFDGEIYAKRVYQGFGQAKPAEELKFGPNIAGWPQIRPLPENLLLKIASVIHDPVTTTDELIPSGETSSYRSNPFKLAEFTLFRKDPAYVGRAKSVQELEKLRQSAWTSLPPELAVVFEPLAKAGLLDSTDLAQSIRETGLGSVIFARKPGDGSAREQAASCQRVLGGDANIAFEYATKRYRSNLINWGMLPFTIGQEAGDKMLTDALIYIPGIRQSLKNGAENVNAFVIYEDRVEPLELKLADLPPTDREIILAGCLMNYYAQQNKEASGC